MRVIVLKPLKWLGDSLERLRRFPEMARRETGYQLCLVQAGRSPTDWKPIPFVGPGVIEVRIHAEGEFRALYVAKFDDAIYVLHVFPKKSQKAASLDLELGRRRYKELIGRLVK